MTGSLGYAILRHGGEEKDDVDEGQHLRCNGTRFPTWKLMM